MKKAICFVLFISSILSLFFIGEKINYVFLSLIIVCALSLLLMGNKKEIKLFSLTVDYDTDIDKLRKEYEKSDPHINLKDFPTDKNFIGKKIEITVGVFDYGYRNLSSEDIIEDMEREGFRPAQPLEVLTFGLNYPVKHILVALGSRWMCSVGKPLGVAIYEDNAFLLRFLELRSDYRFLGVKI